MHAPPNSPCRALRLGFVLVDILHLDHAELDIYMAKLQVRLIGTSHGATLR